MRGALHYQTMALGGMKRKHGATEKSTSTLVHSLGPSRGIVLVVGKTTLTNVPKPMTKHQCTRKQINQWSKTIKRLLMQLKVKRCRQQNGLLGFLSLG